MLDVRHPYMKLKWFIPASVYILSFLSDASEVPQSNDTDGSNPVASLEKGIVY